MTNPIVPLIFAVAALGLSLANHFVSQYLDKENPKIKMSELSGKSMRLKKYEHTFFTTHSESHIDLSEVNLSSLSL